jgi:hypothetical protein
MNIFFLDIDPQKSAEFHCDKHVVKMILEIVQLLYTAHHILGSQLPTNAYKPVSKSHPTAIWIRTCIENYTYSIELAMCLCKEYTYRYNKIHSCESHVNFLKLNVPVFEKKETYKDTTVLSTNTFFQSKGITHVPLAMPVECMVKDTIQSYRKYYIMYKKGFVKWTNRPVPHWFSFIRRF